MQQVQGIVSRWSAMRDDLGSFVKFFRPRFNVSFERVSNYDGKDFFESAQIHTIPKKTTP